MTRVVRMSSGGLEQSVVVAVCCGLAWRGARQSRGCAGRYALRPAPSAARRVPCAARLTRAAPPLALARAQRCCAAPLRSELDMLAVAPPLARRRDAPRKAALLGAAHARTGLRTRGFARCSEVFVDEPHERCCAAGGTRWGRLCGGEKRSSARGSPAPQATDRRGRREVAARSAPRTSGTAAALAMRASQRSRP